MLDTNQKPTLTIVSGRPGSGKTTLARMIARTLPCPLISRDEIYEGIFHTFDHDLDLASKDYVAKSAFDTFFRVIELLVSSSVTLVAEAAFQDQRWRNGLESIVPMADIKVIHCTVDPELARQRVVRRRIEKKDIPGSTLSCVNVRPADARPQVVRPFHPLSLPVPSLNVATADSYAPPLDEIIAFIMFR